MVLPSIEIKNMFGTSLEKGTKNSRMRELRVCDWLNNGSQRCPCLNPQSLCGFADVIKLRISRRGRLHWIGHVRTASLLEEGVK